jgi:LAS seventeen-binding protein 5
MDRNRDRGIEHSTLPPSSQPNLAKEEGDGSTNKGKEKKAPKLASGTEEFITIHVNDRLGTKATIPCLSSDSIRDLRLLVAARIGREPHEILLKRQGERPFKDFLTLEDYSIKNGMQLDLEVGTGD